MDILTLSLAVQKTLRELGIDRDIKKTVVLPETTVENNGNGIYFCPYVNLTIGETYVVKLNNEIYCTECFVMDGDIAIGNRAEVNDGISTGEPFLYALAQNGEGAVCMVVNPDTFEPLPYDSITIEIYQETTTTTPIKSEYLPDLTGKAGTVKLEKTVVLPETISTTIDDSMFVFPLVSLIAGETYTVVFNGAVWKSECIDAGGQIWLGNKVEVTGEVTKEPFICVVDDGLYCLPFDPDTLEVPKLDSVTLEIYQETETIHPIDPKFLPGGNGIPLIMLETMPGQVEAAPLNDRESAQVADAIANSEIAVFTIPGPGGVPKPVLCYRLQTPDGPIFVGELLANSYADERTELSVFTFLIGRLEGAWVVSMNII